MKKIFTTDGWFDLENKDISNIGKFLYLKNEDFKIFICENHLFISNHSDLADNFCSLNLGKFTDFEIIGAGDMNNGTISHFKSYGFKISTEKEIALEIIELLDNPSLGGMADYLINSGIIKELRYLSKLFIL